MSKAKIAITLDEQFIEDIDRLVSTHTFQNAVKLYRKQ